MARRHCARPAQLVLLETPSNPMLELVDLAAVAGLAHAAGAIVVVDNVFATPLLQQPLTLGADVVVYSCTKHIDGQGRVLGGAVLGSKKWIEETLQPFLRNTGPALSPFNAWMLLKGLETLPLRIDACVPCDRRRSPSSSPRAAKSGGSGTRPASDHPQQNLARAQMTAGGTVVTFELAGGKDAAFSAMNAFQLIAISNNLGEFEIARHASGDHHPYANRRRGAREARHHRRCDPTVDRPRGSGGPEGRPCTGADRFASCRTGGRIAHVWHRLIWTTGTQPF